MCREHRSKDSVQGTARWHSERKRGHHEISPPALVGDLPVSLHRDDLDLREKSPEKSPDRKRSPNPEQAHLCEAWLFTCDSPGWLGPSLPWGRPSNQEIFSGLSTRPTSFWTASSCQTQHPVSPITENQRRSGSLYPDRSTRTSKLFL